MIGAIRERFPTDGILAEESGAHRTDAAGTTRGLAVGRTWVIDPLDGTINYANGIPYFCVAIGLVVDGVPTVGVVHDPMRSETFSAALGGPARLGDVAVTASDKAALGDCVVSLALGGRAVATRGRAIRKAIRVSRNMGSAALALAYVANGRFDAFLQSAGMSAWDVAAAGLIAERAGATVTGHEGRCLVRRRRDHPDVRRHRRAGRPPCGAAAPRRRAEAGSARRASRGPAAARSRLGIEAGGAVAPRLTGERREAKVKISEVEGIDGIYADKAGRGRDHDHRGAARARRRRRAGRTGIESATGISGKLILEWVNHVDLMRLDGVGSEYADLLEAAGVDSPAELAHRNAANLAQTFQELVAARPGTGPARSRPRRPWPDGSRRRRRSTRPSRTAAGRRNRASPAPAAAAPAASAPAAAPRHDHGHGHDHAPAPDAARRRAAAAAPSTAKARGRCVAGDVGRGRREGAREAAGLWARIKGMFGGS